MKTLRNIAMLTLLSVGFTYAQNITVQGEKKLNTDFKKYKTYGWMTNQMPNNQLIEYTYEEYVPASQVAPVDRADKTVRHEGKKMKGHKNKDVVVYSYSFIVPANDSSINNTAINSVQQELEGRGYRKDAVSPDLLVAYKIFDRSTQIKGYNAAPTDLNGATSDQVHQPQDTMTYALKPGTVFITMVDAKTSQVIWEGYASGVAKKDDIINDSERVKEAINLIFKKFEFRGDKYSMN